MSQPSWRRHGRYRRSQKSCGKGQGFYSKGGYCCKNCPAGHFVEEHCSADGQDPKCKVCPDRTFLAFENYVPKCRSCTFCASDSQVEKTPCNATQDVICGCKEGFYDNDGSCHPCTKCQNRKVNQNCSEKENTVCDEECLPGFYLEKNECLLCAPSNSNCEDLKTPCAPLSQCVRVPSYSSSNYGVLVVFPLLLLLVLGLFVMYRHRKKEHIGGDLCIAHPEETPTSTETISEAKMFLTFEEPPVGKLCFASDTQGHVPPLLQKGCALYDIIDCVPARRWKEFMRNLEFPDKEIERVEVEIGSFRDQQYEMLRRWCQLKSASMEIIYQALERMHLSGCADELRTKLGQYS
ncbi:tumor necrosis factor receptor superfamily member 25 isoform X2 [Hyperolius riggenbachi]